MAFLSVNLVEITLSTRTGKTITKKLCILIKDLQFVITLSMLRTWEGIAFYVFIKHYRFMSTRKSSFRKYMTK